MDINSPVSLYIHVPFCTQKCPYCAFVKTQHSAIEEAQFVTAICQEIWHYYAHFGPQKMRSLFIGGGTPNRLSDGAFSQLMETVYAVFEEIPYSEKTIEMNPESIRNSQLKMMTRYGINRVSMGVQSFVPEELQFLGRSHTPDRISTTVKMLRDHGLENINLDLIFGLPKSTLASLQFNLEQAFKLNPPHLSTYSLTIEPGTPFKRKKVTPLHSDLAQTHFKFIRDTLMAAGYQHYEVSAFAKKNYQSQHNLVYWNLDPFIGVGPGAASFFDGRLYHNLSQLSAYYQDPRPPIFKRSISKIPPNELIQDFLLTNLRRLDGIDLSAFEVRFGVELPTYLGEALVPLLHNKFLKLTSTRLKVTEKGLYVLDRLLVNLFL